jgi:hypothetical protein
MANENEYRYENRRPTDELESDDTALPIAKKVLLYGWTGTAKIRINVTAAGLLGVTI